MVGKQNGLGPLQMGIAGQNHFLVGLRLSNHRFQHRFCKCGNLIDLLLQVHPQIESYLIVSASGGVKLLTHIAQALGQHLLHKHMDILAGHIEFQRAGVQIG